MAAYYDTYDYTSYWNGREYEHESEVIALKEFLTKIPKIDKALEIGGGYGRLVPYYIYRTKSTTLTDPSARLLSIARDKLGEFANLKYAQSTIENLNNKFRAKSFDFILMVRVMHHLSDVNGVFATAERLLAPEGYFILEFANKIHFKKVLEEFFRGNFGFIKDRGTIDVRSAKSKKQKTIAFLNYHPEVIKEELQKHNFEIVEVRSVSNFRNPFLKKHLLKDILLSIEKYLQIPFSYIYFGPSIFILARKRG